MSNNYLIFIPDITKGMKSIGPKCLLELRSNMTILEYQIKSIKAINRRNKIFLATGFQHNKILKNIDGYKNVTAIYEKNFSEFNETKHLLNYIEYINKDFDDIFLINNGIIFRNDCFKGIKKNESKIFFLDKHKDNFNIGCSNLDCKYLFYDLPQKWSECAFLKKEDVEAIYKLSKQGNIQNYFLFEILNIIYDSNNITSTIISHRDIMKINSMVDLPKAKRFI